MSSYCEQARSLLKNKEIDPFMKAAWLQWAFLRIHPFEDGNGRVSRIISSIPLSKLNLPPIIVTNKHKQEYFKALHKADRYFELNELAIFLRLTMDFAMTYIENLPTDESLGNSQITSSLRRKAVPGTSTKLK